MQSQTQLHPKAVVEEEKNNNEPQLFGNANDVFNRTSKEDVREENKENDENRNESLNSID